jgi:hypothetical protein
LFHITTLLALRSYIHVRRGWDKMLQEVEVNVPPSHHQLKKPRKNANLRARSKRGEVATREQYEGNFKNFPLRELHFRLEFLIITRTGELCSGFWRLKYCFVHMKQVRIG